MHPTNRTLRRRTFTTTALAASGLLAAACGTGTVTGASGSSRGTVSGDTQVVEVRATEFGFTPATIRVSAGKPVRLVLTNAGQIEHDLRVDKVPATGVKASEAAHGHRSDVAAHSEQGKQAWVEFTPTAAGTYDLSCTIAGHKEAGMKGTLIVG